MSKKVKVTVVGSGYVGMSLAVLLAQHNDVTVLDIDPDRVDQVDLLPKKVTKTRERFPAKLTHGRSHDEEQAIHRRADYWLSKNA